MGKRNIKLILSYDGSRYDGWQKQGNTENTIQGKLEVLFSKMTGHLVEVHGAGRTDAGVHARAQVANVKLETQKSPEEIMTYANLYLPDDIAVLSAEEVNMRFHSRICAKGKVYGYYIQNSSVPDPFLRKYSSQVRTPLSIEEMQKAAKYLIGTHDFRSFCTASQKKKNTERTIWNISLEKNDTQIAIKVSGDGFLYNMIRIITGTLIEVGEGSRNADEMPVILEAKDRKKAGKTAPAQGLFLEEVFF